MAEKFISIDGIYKKTKEAGPKPAFFGREKVKEKPFKYFYKSLQIVLSMWIVTILAITVTPWLDYWVKSTIKNTGSNRQTLGQSVAAVSSPSPKTIIDEIPTFELKNNRLEINAPIVEGVDAEALKKGIGHHPDSVWPDKQGNVVLAGHNFDLDADNPYSQVFISLRLVEINDEVTVQYQGKKYTYKVFKKETINPKDTSLFGKADDFILTFYTCDPPYTDWKRLVFQAKLTKIE